MNFTLFRYSLKRLFRLWLIFFLLISAYAAAMICMCDLDHQTMEMSLPSSSQIMLLFGVVSGPNIFTAFVVNYLYGLALFLLPTAFCLLAAQQVMVRHIETRSMSWLLASPNSRTHIVVTQGMALVVSLALLMAASAGVTIGISEYIFPGQLDVQGFALLTAELFALQLCILSIGFFFSCICSEVTHSLVWSGCICLIFYGVKLLSNFGGSLSVLRYATIFSVINPGGILAWEQEACLLPLLLVAISVVLFLLSVRQFKRRNLPL